MNRNRPSRIRDDCHLWSPTRWKVSVVGVRTLSCSCPRRLATVDAKCSWLLAARDTAGAVCPCLVTARRGMVMLAAFGRSLFLCPVRKRGESVNMSPGGTPSLMKVISRPSQIRSRKLQVWWCARLDVHGRNLEKGRNSVRVTVPLTVCEGERLRMSSVMCPISSCVASVARIALLARSSGLSSSRGHSVRFRRTLLSHQQDDVCAVWQLVQPQLTATAVAVASRGVFPPLCPTKKCARGSRTVVDAFKI